MTRIDLNCDMGELPEAIADGTQEALLRSITSANVACGGHAGDERTMRTTVEQALRAGAAVGAHPGYPDRENFGRLELKMPLDAVTNSVCEQVRTLARVAVACGAKLVHVKPHGALYNQAVGNRELAEAIAKGVTKAVGAPTDSLGKDLVLVGLAGSPMLNGTLRSRKFENALIRDPAEAAKQALSIAEHGIVTAHDGTAVKLSAQTICIHGDTPGAPQIAATVARTLRDAGVSLTPLVVAAN
jgi:UPF0271 protein